MRRRGRREMERATVVPEIDGHLVMNERPSMALLFKTYRNMTGMAVRELCGVNLRRWVLIGRVAKARSAPRADPTAARHGALRSPRNPARTVRRGEGMRWRRRVEKKHAKDGNAN